MSKKPYRQNEKSLSELGRQFSDATIFMHHAIAKKAGLTSSDHKYLGILLQNGAMTAGELSQKTGLSTGAVTGLIDRLEEKKLVERELDKGDRRKIIIVPNYKNAMNLLGDIFNELQQKMNNLKSQFNAKEVETIEKYLLSAIKTMKETTKSLQNGYKNE
jgi:DNA-binding MarR family transcriptional regulator